MLSRIFVLESSIDVANQVIVIVVAHHHFLDLAVLAHLAPKIFIERIEVVLQLGRVHLVLRVVGWVLVEVGQENGLGV